MVVTMVIKRIMCPHKVVYSSASKPATYEDLSVSAFVHGYVIVMHSEHSETMDKMAYHLVELMRDIDLCGWEKIRAYHGVWINQME